VWERIRRRLLAGGACGLEGVFVHEAQEVGVAHYLDAAYFLDVTGAQGGRREHGAGIAEERGDGGKG
jgi:hypothetical protein